MVHCLPDPAGAAYPVDGSQVMLVPALDRLADAQVDAQRRVEEGRLDVVHRDSVAPEHNVDPAARYQPSEGRGRSGVNDRRPQDGDDLLAGSPVLAHEPCDPRDHQPLGLLRGDRRPHELEGPRRLVVTERHYTDAAASHHEQVARPDLDQRYGSGAARCRGSRGCRSPFPATRPGSTGLRNG